MQTRVTIEKLTNPPSDRRKLKGKTRDLNI